MSIANTCATAELPRKIGLSAAGSTSSHLVRLPGTDWNLWRTFVVRGAGFPAGMVEHVSAEKAAAAADEYLRNEERAWRHTDTAWHQLCGELRGSPEARRQLRKMRAAILAGKVEEVRGRAEAEAAAEAWRETERAQAAFVAAYRADEEVVQERLVELSRNPRFREAMLWQGLKSSQCIWRDLQRETDFRSAGKKFRQALRQMAMRVQRYCVKNDSIGFFGPVGWGWMGERAERMEMRPGPGLVAKREVFFEGWSIDALAASLEEAHGPELKPWVEPRVKTGVWIQGHRAYRPQRKEYALSEEERVVITECDGQRTAREVACSILHRGVLPAGTKERQVFAVLEKLVGAGLIAWRLEVAPQLYPELELRSRLERIGEEGLRKKCLESLEELDGARGRVGIAEGDLELKKTLEELEECFTRRTGQSATRRDGQTYAGRTLVYEDCRRDCEVEIGSRLLEDLAPPLGIILDAARWILAELGREMQDQLAICWSELAEREHEQRKEIDCHLFVAYATTKLYLTYGRITAFDSIAQQLQEMWHQVLGEPLQSSPSRVTFALDEARARAARTFPGREVGYCLGRYICPDLMIAAASADAIRRGDYTPVIGEIHCENTVAASFLVTQHPCPSQLFQAVSEDTANEMVLFRQRPSSSWLARTNNALIQPQHWRYAFGDDLPHHPPSQMLPAGMFVATRVGSSVVVRARDGSIQFDALELFGGLLVDEADRLLADFIPRASHTPRMSLGNLVIARERWNVSPKEMPFLGQKEPAQQFLGIRRWRQANGMPQRVFVKSPTERKPWFLDFDSPMLTAIFVSSIKQLPEEAQVSLVEMFPDLNELWLADCDGRNFTSELRLVARIAPERAAPAV
jgi:hypothetical protein